MVVRGSIWWADLGIPHGSEPGFTRPVLIIQSNTFNNSRIDTVVVVPLTSQLKHIEAPGNVLLTKVQTGLDQNSCANVSQITTIDRSRLTKLVGILNPRLVRDIEAGILLVIGLV